MKVNLSAINGVETEGTAVPGIQAMTFHPPTETSLFGCEEIYGS